jgi:hypothetical protein
MKILFPKLFVAIFNLGEYPHYKLGVYLISGENDGRNIDFYLRTEQHPTCLPKCTKKPCFRTDKELRV